MTRKEEELLETLLVEVGNMPLGHAIDIERSKATSLLAIALGIKLLTDQVSWINASVEISNPNDLKP